MNITKSNREQLTVILPDGTKLLMRRYAKRNKLKDISEVARKAINMLMGMKLI